MLDLNFIRNNLVMVRQKVAAKGVAIDFDNFADLDKKRRELITEAEEIKSKRNQLAKETGRLKRENQDTSKLQQESIELSKKLGTIDKDLKGMEEEFQSILLNIPNLAHESVPTGKDENDNQEVRQWGHAPEFDFKAKPHWELGETNCWLDFTRATKIAGSRFALSLGSIAKLERVLIQFMLDIHTEENGYTEVVPPFIANDQSLTATGNLPKFEEDLFKLEGYNYYLIPTAEVPLTNIYRDETLKPSQLSTHFVAYTPCFRSEAGSYGKDIRGIIRQHQFNKVELLKFTHPDESYQELENLTSHAETILQKLNLHYRVSLLCSGDLSFSSAKTYDLEVWMPARQGYLEISTCSNFEDFQARRAKIRYKDDQGRKGFVHTLNGSGLAIGRTVAAIMENYQTADGRIRIPEVLKPYFNGGDFF